MQAHTTIIRRILVVCSDPATRRVIEDATRAWMFETVACSLLRDAEDLLARQEFALVFCEDRFEDGGYRDLLSVVDEGCAVDGYTRHARGNKQSQIHTECAESIRAGVKRPPATQVRETSEDPGRRLKPCGC